MCPENYNPADFLLEIANNDYGAQNSRLTKKIQNGMNNSYRSEDHAKANFLESFECSSEPTESTSQLINQLRQLLIRNFLITSRDKTLALMRLTIHLVIGIFIGIMYNGIGEDASNILNIYKLLFFNIFLIMFTAFSSLQTTCKLSFLRSIFFSSIFVYFALQFHWICRLFGENISTDGTQRPLTTSRSQFPTFQ
jgi:hypothetical protein